MITCIGFIATHLQRLIDIHSYNRCQHTMDANDSQDVVNRIQYLDNYVLGIWLLKKAELSTCLTPIKYTPSVVSTFGSHLKTFS